MEVQPAAEAALAHFRAALPEVAALYSVLRCDAVGQERWLAEHPAATIRKRPGQKLRRAAMAERLRALAAEARAPVPALGDAAVPGTLIALTQGVRTANPSEPQASLGPSGAPGAAGASAAAQGMAAPAESGAMALHPAEAAPVRVPNGAPAAGQQKPGKNAMARKKVKREAAAEGADLVEPPAVGPQAARRACLKGQVEAALRVLAAGLPGAARWPLRGIGALELLPRGRAPL